MTNTNSKSPFFPITLNLYVSKLKNLLAILFLLIFQMNANAYDPIDCYRELALVDPDISKGLATKLCSASWSAEPINCYVEVAKVDKGMTRGIAIDLCAGAIDAEKTVACYLRAGEINLNRGLSTSLCGAKKQDRN